MLNVTVRGFVLRIPVGKVYGGERPASDFRALVRKRIEEAAAQAERFVERIEGVRSKLSTMLERHPGMRLVSLQMESSRVQAPFDWDDGRLKAWVEYMRDLFEPSVERITEFAA